MDEFKQDFTNTIIKSQNINNRFLYVTEIRNIFKHFKSLPKYDM